jgi:hypothetical protein
MATSNKGPITNTPFTDAVFKPGSMTSPAPTNTNKKK